MIDFNGNGKIDPVDIGISAAMLEDDEAGQEPESEPEKERKGGGCLTACALVCGIAGGLAWIAGRMV